MLARHLNLDLMRGDKIGLIGANGVGKSSLLKAIQGLIPVLEGTVEWGRHVKIAYFDQENTRVNPDNTVLGGTLAAASYRERAGNPCPIGGGAFDGRKCFQKGGKSQRW